MFGHRIRCDVPRAAFETRDAAYHALIGRLRLSNPGLLIFDPTNFLCDAKECHILNDGRSLYRDGDHFSGYGGKILGEHLIDWLATQ